MYDEEKASKPASAIDEIQHTAKRRLEQCMVEIDSLEKQAESMEMHRRSLHTETSTLKRILEASRNEDEKDADLPRVSGSSAGYASHNWQG